MYKVKNTTTDYFNWEKKILDNKKKSKHLNFRELGLSNVIRK